MNVKIILIERNQIRINVIVLKGITKMDQIYVKYVIINVKNVIMIIVVLIALMTLEKGINVNVSQDILKQINNSVVFVNLNAKNAKIIYNVLYVNKIEINIIIVNAMMDTLV